MAGIPLASRWSSRQWGILAGGGYLLLYLLWLLWGGNLAGDRAVIASLALLFASLVALWLTVRMCRQQMDEVMRRSWHWLVIGVSLWSLEDLLRLLLQPVMSALQPNPLDFLYLGGLAVVCIGLFRLPRRPRLHPVRLLLYFDTTLTTAALVTLVWLVVLQPLLLSAAGFWGSLSGLADLLVVILISNLFLLADANRLPPAFDWISLGVLAFTASDLATTSVAGVGSYQPGTVADFGWTLGYAFLSLAALTVDDRAQDADPPRRRLAGTLGRLQSLLPLLATVVLGGYAILEWWRAGLVEPLGLYMTVILGLGLIARQSVLTGEIEYQQYANLVSSIAEPAFVCDRRGRLQLVNPALIKAAGVDVPGDLLNRNVQELFQPGEDIATHLTANPSQEWSGEVALLRQDAVRVPVMLALSPLTGAAGKTPFGRSFALAGTAHDLTETKRQQADLQAAYEQITADRGELERLNEELEEMVAEKTADLSRALDRLEEQNISLRRLDEVKSDFVSLVSHELRAPLTNITAGIELLLANARRLPVKHRQDLELVQAEIRRLTRFVETILDLSALDAGRLPLYPAPLALTSAAETLKIQMEHLDGAHRVVWDIPEEMPSLLADEQALVSALFHLLDNAIKYAPQGSISVSAGTEGGRAWVQVRDEGPGIPEEALPWLFERFFRSNAEDSQSVYGHGLGLYIVRRLVEAMEGEIHVCNQAEGGACFTLWLPIIE